MALKESIHITELSMIIWAVRGNISFVRWSFVESKQSLAVRLLGSPRRTLNYPKRDLDMFYESEAL